MMGYLLPTTAPIADYGEDPPIGTWQGHKNRKPPSNEAGVDYTCAYGTPLLAPADGRVYEIKFTNTLAMGRFVTFDLDDGRRVRWIHLRGVNALRVGDRVRRGQVAAYSGASGYGSDWGVGAHVHVTLWPGHFYDFGPDANTLDFDAYADHPAPAGGDATPFDKEDEEDEMAVFTKPSDGATVYLIRDDGTKRGVTSVEWAVRRAAAKVAGVPLPYAPNVATKAELAKIPDAPKS